MITKDFYNTIDQELDVLLEKYKEDAYLQKHGKAKNNQKSYALLIWFLEFYGKISNYTPYITDGTNDSSCDIIFDKKDKQGTTLFYIVQSKWNNSKNSEKESDKDEILKALSDFETILRGGKKKVNAKLQQKLEELDQHLKDNGAVKFLFLSLSQYTQGSADENIKSFINEDEKITFEVIDINRIRGDYIDRKYKQIDPINPLETYLNPEESPITLNIERLADKSGNCIKLEKPFEAYVFLLRPKTIYDLFNKYGFALFYKNVRNPLLKSQFNEDIERTAIENPAYFWYYNNGITAITYLLPTIGKRATKINLTGLQVINGAQTVYSIYRAYKNASRTKRTQMNREALITLRLLKSGGKDFDLNVTRYTNSQNPIQDRDFYANDDIQVALQQASYKTKVWYEKRRDEFREIPKGVISIPNYIFADAYLAYQLQDYTGLIKNYKSRKVNKNLNFISRKDDKDGLYENIFNEYTSFEDMLCAFYLFRLFHGHRLITSYQEVFDTGIFTVLTLFKDVFSKYLKAKFKKDEKINVSKYVINLIEKNEEEILAKTFKFLQEVLIEELKEKNAWLLVDQEYIKNILKPLDITVEDIEGMKL